MRSWLAALRGAAAFARLVVDPSRLDRVLTLSSPTGESPSLERTIRSLKAQPVTASRLELRRRLPPLSLAALQELPPGTLGRAFAEHARSRKLDLSAFPSIQGAGELQYVRNHLYETHDIWHVVTGFDTDVAGELGLMAFWQAQLPDMLFPLLILAAGLLNTALRRPEAARERMGAIQRGWRLGKEAQPFFGVDWSELWDKPLAEVRETLALR